MTTFDSPFGQFTLHRYPRRPKEQLRAWDAADEYVLQYIIESGQVSENLNPLIINDSFGALTVALAEFQPQMQSDSYLALQGAKENLRQNEIDDERVLFLTSLESPQRPINLVIIKIPKSLAMLEDQLYRLRSHLQPNTQIIGAGMAKHIHTSTLKLFEKIIGPTHTSLAMKKARLIHSQFNESLQHVSSPYPKQFQLEKPALTLSNHANVFSQSKLDIGSRFFLEHIPSFKTPKTIVDLGCGNGLIGIIAALKNPQSKIIFTDESYMAIDSAKTNFIHALPDRSAQFHVTDCLNGIEKKSVDVILNNPPFHQQHSVGDQIAWQMFKESLTTLKKGGELWVIGNRHLNYHVKLKRLFGNVKTIASNKKFVILRSIKR